MIISVFAFFLFQLILIDLSLFCDKFRTRIRFYRFFANIPNEFSLQSFEMVCIPCILVPLALWLYNKFLHPYVIQLVPIKWRAKVDGWLYPTCPLKMAKQPVSVENSTEANNKETTTSCCETDKKKD